MQDVRVAKTGRENQKLFRNVKTVTKTFRMSSDIAERCRWVCVVSYQQHFS